MKGITMADAEMVEKPEAEQVEEATEEVIVEEPEEEKFDKDRAMATIKNLRKFEKDTAKLKKEIETYKLKEEEDKKAKLSEIDRLKLEKQEAEQKLAELTLKERRREAAKIADLPDEFVERIQGNTPEEMVEDAKKMKAAIPIQKSKIGVTNPGPNASSDGETPEQMKRRLAKIMGYQ